MLNHWINKIFTRWVVAGTFLATVLLVTIQSIRQDGIVIENIEYEYTGYNNYVIFRNAFKHLIENKDLYIYYFEENWDLYKYSPTFAVLMAPFHYLTDPIGLFLWNALNSFILLAAIWMLPNLKREWKIWSLAFLFIEMVTSIQNSQANGLMAGLIIMAFALTERKRYASAAFLVTLSVFIKPFGIFAYTFFLFHPHILKHAAYSLFFSLFLLALPMLVISVDQLLFLYKSWFNLLFWDMDESTGISVQGVLNKWFGLYPNKSHTLLLGIVMLLVPLLRINKWKNFMYRVNYLAYILIWIIIFNHKAESPTFVIAVSGIAIWFAYSAKQTYHYVLLLTTLFFTVFSATDLYPHAIRAQYLQPYLSKAIPCILVFLAIAGELLLTTSNNHIDSSKIIH